MSEVRPPAGPGLLWRALRPALFALDAERAHHLTLSALGAACFVTNLWVTMDASQMQAINAKGRAMPVLPQIDAH